MKIFNLNRPTIIIMIVLSIVFHFRHLSYCLQMFGFLVFVNRLRQDKENSFCRMRGKDLWIGRSVAILLHHELHDDLFEYWSCKMY